MKNYNPVVINDIEKLSNIIKSKNYSKKHNPCANKNCTRTNDLCLKRVLEINQILINSRYNVYSRSLPILSIPDFQKEAFKSLYTNLTADSRDIINKIKDIFPATCPYCGIDSGATTEHILPKDIFSEYSIYSKNLIPCCSTCNSLKSTKITETSGEYSVMNFYEAEAPEEEFLDIRIIEIEDEIPIFKYCILEGAPEVFKNHFKNLKLIKRYKKNSNDIITEIAMELERMKKNFTKNQAKKLMLGKYEDLREQYGYNNWRALIYRGVAQSEKYLDSLYGIYRNVEEIDEKYDLELDNHLKINCEVTQDGFRKALVDDAKSLKIGASLRFYIEKKSTPNFDKIFWKIQNSGKFPEERDKIRGEIVEGIEEKIENIDFQGKHFAECYLIKGNKCIARGKKYIEVK